MAPYWRRRRQNRRYYWRRRFRPWRFRGPFRSRWRRKRYRRYRVSRKFKLTKIKLKQFQPKTIRNCRIKGIKCLFMGSANRLGNNYWQYPTSIIPEKWPGGGGWGLLVFSLASMYEDFQKLQNYWTNSNAGLPLFRFLGFKLTFYQHESTDYVVEIDNCWPMVDTPLKHANCHPQRMLMGKKTIIIPSQQTKRLRHGKITKRVRPPAQMTNQWYFQKDLCNTKLLMIAATACDLRNYFIGPDWESNNITLYALNTYQFQNHNFQHPSITSGYKPKNNLYLYSTSNGTTTIPTSQQSLIYLGDTEENKPGKPGKVGQTTQEKTYWGNPFYKSYLTGDIPVYYSTKAPTDTEAFKTPEQIKKNLTEIHGPLYSEVRYNPDKDTGQGNVIYFLNNYSGTGDSAWDEPADETKKITGLPIWVAIWGWPDWIKKLGLLPRVDDDQILCIKSDFFTPKFPCYVFLDETFINGQGPYETPVTTKQYFHWYPQFTFQQQQTELLCRCGPGVSRIKPDKTVQAKMSYTAYTKWGGCPSTLEKVYDPCSQPRWPTTSNINETIQIQNPEADPTKILYSWDVRRDFITGPAIKRLKKDETTDETCCLSTGSKSSPAAALHLQTLQEESDQTSSEEEETPTLQSKLLRLRRQQHILHKQLLKLASTSSK
nr:MAG: ORF1 [TTV-like mini virus]